MAIVYPLDILATWPGWTTEFDLFSRDELSRQANGVTRSKNLGSPLWRLTAVTKSLSINMLDEWRAKMRALENGQQQFKGYSLSRCFPIAYPNGSWPGNYQNLVTNPGFENDFTGWDKVAGTIISNDSHSGVKAANCPSTSGSGTLRSTAMFPVIAGATHDVRAWLKGDVSSAAGNYIAIYWFDASGNPGSPAQTYSHSNGAVTTSYVRYGGPVTAPAGATQAKLGFFTNASTNTRLFVDDTSVLLTTGAGFDGTAATVFAVGAGNKSLRIDLLPPGFQLRVGDLLQVTHGGILDVYSVQEAVTASASGLTPEFEVRPHLWPGVAVGNLVSIKRPWCPMTIVPGSISSSADLQTGRGTISFQAMESR